MSTISSKDSNTYGKMLQLTSLEADKVRENWHKPVIGVNTLKISSRTINYYESIGLIEDPRGDNKKGWRKFTYVEAIYLLIVRELRHYGIDTKFIKTFYNSFIRSNDEEFVNALFLARMGYKVMIKIESNQTEYILGVDNPIEPDTLTNFPPSEIRLNLACFIEYLDNYLKGRPLCNDISQWFHKELDDEILKPIRHDLNTQENILIDRFRNLKPGESLTVKRNNNGETITEHTQTIHIDNKLEKSLSDIMSGFGEFTIRMSGGKAVKGTIRKSTKM